MATIPQTFFKCFFMTKFLYTLWKLVIFSIVISSHLFCSTGVTPCLVNFNFTDVIHLVCLIHDNGNGPCNSLYSRSTKGGNGGILDLPWCSSGLMYVCRKVFRNFLKICWLNYTNPIYGVSTICHQVRCLRWGYPSLFHTATSLFIWYKMFRMRDISYRLIWMKFISMLSVYVQSVMRRRFNWWIIAVLT